MGDKPEDWRAFRATHPHFFPETPSGVDRPGFRNTSEWIYVFTEKWEKESAELIATTGRQELKGIKTPLYWYRDRLRYVWLRDDPDGKNLMVLLGFEQEAGGAGGAMIRPFFAPGHRPGSGDTLGGLPKGRQVVRPDAIEGLPEGQPTVQMSGRIEWEFGCALQQAVYELMQSRWRAKVCPVCNRFFVAAKTAQKHCSPECYRMKKEKESLEYYHREGKYKRAEQASKSRGKKSR